MDITVVEFINRTMRTDGVNDFDDRSFEADISEWTNEERWGQWRRTIIEVLDSDTHLASFIITRIIIIIMNNTTLAMFFSASFKPVIECDLN